MRRTAIFHKWFSRGSIVCFMLIACGCTLSTTITVLQHREPVHAPFKEDYSRCCDSVQRHPDPYAWTWRIGWIELFNEEACREVQVWDCLESYGVGNRRFRP